VLNTLSFLDWSLKNKKKIAADLDKQGVFTGAYALNPVNDERIPIWVGNFVLADYGSGMVMAVPAHDQRDYEFAKKYNLKIKEVIRGERLGDKTGAFEGEGVLVNSSKFTGGDSEKAKQKITEYLSKKKLGKKQIQFKLKDWLISRQRYWGAPIPIIYCDKCGIVAVPEKNLPIKLPEKVKFGKDNPLKTAKSWVSVKCPKCNAKARRETDTMDTFTNSSWYYLRYCDPKNKKKIFDSKKTNYWCPVDQYIGGPEHITMHLIYIRFYTKFLKDLGIINFDEPAKKYFTQGIVYGSDGFRMSKSRGNVIEPLGTIKKYGADTLRLYLLSVASPNSSFNWDEKGIQGSCKFVNKIVGYFNNLEFGKIDARTESKLNKTIKEVTEYIQNFKYNLAIISLRNLFNSLPEKTSKEVIEKFLKLFSVFCPHISEELWHKLGNKKFISLEKWPKFDSKKINKEFEKQEELVDKIVSDIINIVRIVGKRKKVYVYTIPNEIKIYSDNLDLIQKRTGLDVMVYAVNDKLKYDPKNSAKKAKPNHPGIYLE